MGLISKTVTMKWNGRNKKWFESKGYVYTKMGEEFEVRVEDLFENSDFLVVAKCDGCGEIKKIPWNNYLGHVKSIGKYYCKKCANQGHQKFKSFHDWCIEKHCDHLLERWDYDLNQCSPNNITYSTHENFFFKCSNDKHPSELINIHQFVNNSKHKVNIEHFSCKLCNSFEQWCLENNRQDILDRWDYELNQCKPIDIFKKTSEKYYFRCPQGLHKSELKQISSFLHLDIMALWIVKLVIPLHNGE
jgi:hypothetical protein